MRTLRFLSGNEFKIREVETIFSDIDITILPIDHKINELQTFDVPELVYDKCIRAFERVKRPIFVEHTSLYISSMNGFPGGLTQIFWDTIKAERFASTFGCVDDPSVKATTRIAYCDGRKIHQFEGEILGTIAKEPRGNREFQWDCIFIPEGETQTFAEMGEKKNQISMRRRALKKFAEFLVKLK